MSGNIIQNEKVRQYQKVLQHQKDQLQKLVFQKSYSIKSASILLDINYATAKSIIAKFRKSKIRQYYLINKKLRQCHFKKIEYSTSKLEIKSLVSGLLISECIYQLQ
ncbi:unnamed protein product [Paramecium octaurelia]|uniref:Helix-turn-helix domain-containing protein n=1 Tax=Paramecium octaurelia TaxID=43137 RepID=A0A8S1YDL2_PAROT|nr:unnamed protein product [Paramecium octaurelia]